MPDFDHYHLFDQAAVRRWVPGRRGERRLACPLVQKISGSGQQRLLNLIPTACPQLLPCARRTQGESRLRFILLKAIVKDRFGGWVPSLPSPDRNKLATELSLLSTWSVALAGPGTVGVKVKLNSQLSPGGRVAPQSLVSAACPFHGLPVFGLAGDEKFAVYPGLPRVRVEAFARGATPIRGSMPGSMKRIR